MSQKDVGGDEKNLVGKSEVEIIWWRSSETPKDKSLGSIWIIDQISKVIVQEVVSGNRSLQGPLCK